MSGVQKKMNRAGTLMLCFMLTAVLFFFFFAVMTLIFQSVIRTVLCFCVKARCVSIANIELSCFFVNSCFSAVTFEHFKYFVQG